MKDARVRVISQSVRVGSPNGTGGTLFSGNVDSKAALQEGSFKLGVRSRRMGAEQKASQL